MGGGIEDYLSVGGGIEDYLSHLPVAGETVISLSTQSSGGGKHNGGVQISNDSAHRACRIDTGLGTARPGL